MIEIDSERYITIQGFEITGYRRADARAMCRWASS